MDIELAAKRKQIQNKNQELKQLIQNKKARGRQVAAKNDSMIDLMNLELQNLRLEFLQEEVRDTRPTQSRQEGHQKGCCCLILAPSTLQSASASAGSMNSFFSVTSSTDFYKKLRSLESRKDELNPCACGCCHSTASLVARDVCGWLDTTASVMIFSFTMAWLLYLLLALILLPFLFISRFFEYCLGCCYSRGSRTHRLLEIYRKYGKQMEEIHYTI